MFLKDLKTIPVIQTWEPDLPYLRELSKSFYSHQDLFIDPLIEIDDSSGVSNEYIDMLYNAFDPLIYRYSVHNESVFDRVCNIGMAALRNALDESWDCLLYMEGDIVLSKHFGEVWNEIQLPDNLGLLTFYTPGFEYETPYPKQYPIYRFGGERFYGIQSVLFTRDLVEDMVKNEDSMIKTYPGYNDIRWKEFLLARGKEFWCTHRSYVQHIAPNKPHKAPSNPHVSSTFYD